MATARGSGCGRNAGADERTRWRRALGEWGGGAHCILGVGLAAVLADPVESQRLHVEVHLAVSRRFRNGRMARNGDGAGGRKALRAYVLFSLYTFGSLNRFRTCATLTAAHVTVVN